MAVSGLTWATLQQNRWRRSLRHRSPRKLGYESSGGPGAVLRKHLPETPSRECFKTAGQSTAAVHYTVIAIIVPFKSNFNVVDFLRITPIHCMYGIWYHLLYLYTLALTTLQTTLVNVGRCSKMIPVQSLGLGNLLTTSQELAHRVRDMAFLDLEMRNMGQRNWGSSWTSLSQFLFLTAVRCQHRLST